MGLTVDVSRFAEDLLRGVTTLRREEAILNTPRATNHSDAEAVKQDHVRGLVVATSMLQITLEEATGDVLDRGLAREIVRRVIAAYLDQIGGRS